jgi:hypothetical protein
MTAAEEKAVIDKVCSGDADAFESLVLDNQKKVYNLAFKMTGSEEDALDISQEAFIKAYTGLKNFRVKAVFRSGCTGLHITYVSIFSGKRSASPSFRSY